jgi:hypothetical protein
MYKVKLTIGDWSGDGHEHYEEFVYNSNKTAEEIRQGYKDSCKLTGISFNHNEDYTGLDLKNRTDRHIATEYENPIVSELAVDILFKKFNIDFCKIFGLTEEEILIECEIQDAEQFINLLVDFIKLSLTDLVLEEASFKKSELKNIEPINGWWNKSLNCQFGYGLYE